LRFDFSHFSKVSDDELKEIETIVNQKIREGIELDEKRNVPYKKAIESGVTALFGEKYGDTVRVITFGEGFSQELCGGTHVDNTASIGNFKFVSESSIASGVRRVEAITSGKADELVSGRLEEWQSSKDILGNPKDLTSAIEQMVNENQVLRKQIEGLQKEQAMALRGSMADKAFEQNGINYIVQKTSLPSKSAAKDIAFQLRNQLDNLVMVLATELDGKPGITVIISDNLVEEKDLHAGNLVRDLAKEIGGGGGGQAFFAQAGGSNVNGLDAALAKAKELLNL
jgi:alanyl-tRNA synthetase